MATHASLPAQTTKPDASIDTQSPSYAYTRPSATATRSLVDASSASTASPSDPRNAPPPLQRRKTNNYEAAVQEKRSAGTEAPDASGLKISDKEGPVPKLGDVGRQQSFKQSDQKRMAMERMLSTEDVGKGREKGYSSSVPSTLA